MAGDEYETDMERRLGLRKEEPLLVKGWDVKLVRWLIESALINIRNKK
jgi:hypothetical protein